MYMYQLELVFWLLVCPQFIFMYNMYLNVKVDYLIIRHEDSRMRYKRGVPWVEAIPVNFCEIRRSTKKLGTLQSKFRTTFVTKYSSRSLILESHFTIPPCLFKFNTMFMPRLHPFYTLPSRLSIEVCTNIIYIIYKYIHTHVIQNNLRTPQLAARV